MLICNHCWFVLDESGRKIRAMLPNDDSKYNELTTCDCCRQELSRLSGLYHTMNLRRYTAATI